MGGIVQVALGTDRDNMAGRCHEKRIDFQKGFMQKHREIPAMFTRDASSGTFAVPEARVMLTQRRAQRISTMIDPVHFKDLSAKTPEEIVRNTGAVYDAGMDRYQITVWQNTYAVSPALETVEAIEGSVPARSDYMALFIVHYLLGSVSLPLSGTWVSEKDIPGGAAFFRGPHTLPTDRIARAFGDDPDRFSKACADLNGQPLDMADRAFVFHITPDIPVSVLFWQADEDFPAEAKLLFDRSISQRLALDIVYALAVMVCHTLAGP